MHRHSSESHPHHDRRGHGAHSDDHRDHHHGLWAMIGRHHRGPFGGGPFGRDGDDSSGPGRDGRRGGARSSRMFGHGDLKLLLLALIAEEPRHGYELIRAIEDLCGGTYTPSPGAIYPTLTFLEESGYAAIHQAEEGAKKQYTITEEGRAFLLKNRVEVEAVKQGLKMSSRVRAKLSVPNALRDSVEHLKSALIGHDRNWDAAETARVVAIIDQAVADIGAESGE
ncbi:MAG: PadR family transcriptional regulator [Hydrocarboniphaga sp.]|uniref:PadR family transcriptional regulator n=1 Tax=Hydrocarboniphaga sp. TaxID=2033016 RepID=UPI0026091130|nr:PadR family transcriptional regulator [Hydrocarboniphaga sp.]MDB5970504.1 PadR family transcriptional regulator [Hydrocarboniphaga sp.]